MGGAPSIDLVLLGIGEDGHTASLFPGSAALADTESWVVPTRAPNLGTMRLTLTRAVLAAAKELVFLASGSQKADIVRRVLCLEEGLPAAVVAREGREARFYLDAAAAGAWHQAERPGV